MRKTTIAAMLVAALPTVGHAEKWEKVITLYGWVPGMDTSIATEFGDIESNPSGSDVLSDLEMVFMGTFEAHRGRWGIIKDIIYVDLSDTQDTPFGRLFSEGTTDITAWAVSGYLSYQFAETSTARYEVLGGFRYFDLDTSVSLSEGTRPAQSRSLNDNWFDPVIGVRGHWKLSEKWSASGFIDYGGVSSSSTTWQVVGTLDYNITEGLSARFGYRHMDISKTISGADVDVGLSGPVVGLTYRF